MVGKYDVFKAGLHATKRSSTSSAIWVLSIIIIACIIGFIMVAKMVDEKATRKKWYIGLGITISTAFVSLIIAVIVRMYMSWMYQLDDAAEQLMGEEAFDEFDSARADATAAFGALTADLESENAHGLVNTGKNFGRDIFRRIGNMRNRGGYT